MKGFLCYLKDAESSLSTIEAYERDVRQFLSFLKDWKLEILQVTSKNISDYLLKLTEFGLQPLTIARKLAAIRAFFDYLVSKQEAAVNPTESVSAPQPRKKIDVLTAEQIEVIKKATVEGTRYFDSPKKEAFILRDQAMLEILYNAGLRVSELINLKLPDIDTDNRIVKIKGLRNKIRTLPLRKATLAALERYVYSGRGREKLIMSEAETLNTIFLNSRGQPLSRMGAWKIIHACVKASGIKSHVTPHTFRNSYSAHLLEEGIDIGTLRKLLGHSRYIITWEMGKRLPHN